MELKKIENNKIIKEEIKSSVKPGDIFAASWGYDQTNVDFYQVIKCTDKTAVLKEIESIEEYNGDMAGYCKPIKNKFINDKELKKRLFCWPDMIPAVKIADYETAYKMMDENEKQYFSRYA